MLQAGPHDNYVQVVDKCEHDITGSLYTVLASAPRQGIVLPRQPHASATELQSKTHELARLARQLLLPLAAIPQAEPSASAAAQHRITKEATHNVEIRLRGVRAGK